MYSYYILKDFVRAILFLVITLIIAGIMSFILIQTNFNVIGIQLAIVIAIIGFFIVNFIMWGDLLW